MPGFWSYALDPTGFYEQFGSTVMRTDPEVDSLSEEELEARARQLNNPYRPENAPILLRLWQAWQLRTLGTDSDEFDDPIGGLQPSPREREIFGDLDTIEADTERTRGSFDTFEEQDIDAINPTERQRRVLAGEPDSVTPNPVREESEGGSPIDTESTSSSFTETSSTDEVTWAEQHPIGQVDWVSDRSIILWNFGVDNSQLRPAHRSVLQEFLQSKSILRQSRRL